jgi:hypothetical protein
VIATDANFSGANLLRATFYESDVSGARFDGARMTSTTFTLANMRSCSLQNALLDRISVDRATFQNLDAHGAEGTIMRDSAYLDSGSAVEPLDPDELLAYFLAAGAVVSFFTGRPPTPWV